MTWTVSGRAWSTAQSRLVTCSWQFIRHPCEGLFGRRQRHGPVLVAWTVSGRGSVTDVPLASGSARKGKMDVPEDRSSSSSSRSAKKGKGVDVPEKRSSSSGRETVKEGGAASASAAWPRLVASIRGEGSWPCSVEQRADLYVPRVSQRPTVASEGSLRLISRGDSRTVMSIELLNNRALVSRGRAVVLLGSRALASRGHRRAAGASGGNARSVKGSASARRSRRDAQLA